MGRKLKVKGVLTDDIELQKIINQAIDERDKKRKEEEEEEPKKTAIKKKELDHDHNHNHAKDEHEDCPYCSAAVKELGDGISLCPSCGTKTVKKNAKYLICDNCGDLIPESYLDTDKPCPNCGGKEAHRP